MIAFVFPGQGSQKAGMGQDLCQASPAAARLIAEASAVTGLDLLNLDEAALGTTRYAQLAIVAHSLAAHAALIDALAAEASTAGLAGARAAYAGVSLGEYSAIGAAGLLTPAETMQLVNRRAELMQMAAEVEPGSMSAVLGLPAEAFDAVLSQPPLAGRVYAVNDNAPGQLVIAGESAAVAAAAEPLKAAGARRIVPLAVNAAFHTRLMGPAAEPLAEFARSFNFKPGNGVIFSNRTAGPLPEDVDIPAYLADHMLNPVLWRQEVANMVAAGCTAFVECGTGKVLTGLIKKIVPDVPVFSVEDAASLQATVAALAALQA